MLPESPGCFVNNSDRLPLTRVAQTGLLGLYGANSSWRETRIEIKSQSHQWTQAEDKKGHKSYTLPWAFVWCVQNFEMGGGYQQN